MATSRSMGTGHLSRPQQKIRIKEYSGLVSPMANRPWHNTIGHLEVFPKVGGVVKLHWLGRMGFQQPFGICVTVFAAFFIINPDRGPRNKRRQDVKAGVVQHPMVYVPKRNIHITQ